MIDELDIYRRALGMKKYVRHEGCPDCGSKDNVAVWKDEETGLEQTYCFTCNEVKKAEEGKSNQKSLESKVAWPPARAHYDTLPWRKLTKETCAKYNVVRHGPIVYFPSIWDNVVTGYKCRDFNFPKGDKSCHMMVEGRYTDHFFGWQAVHTNKVIAIALGEFDAMAVYQATGVPCLSPPAGDGHLIKSIKNDFMRLDRFEKIVFLPDKDHGGRAKQPSEYIKEAVALLGEHRCYVANLPFDDPNDCVMREQTALLRQAFYAAEPKALELFYDKPSELIKPNELGMLTGTPLDYPLQGLREHEVTYLIGAPGSGKTTFTQNITFNLMQSGCKVAAVVLEGKHGKFVSGMGNIMCKGNFHESPEDMQDIAKEMLDSQLKVARLSRRDSTVANICRTIRAAVKVADCKVVVVDNLTGAANPDKLFESSSSLVLALDDLAMELSVHILVVAHIGRSSYAKNKDGVVEPPSLSSGFGTGHVERFGYNIIGVHRDNTLTRLEILKNREFGPTNKDVFYGRLQDGAFRYFTMKEPS